MSLSERAIARPVATTLLTLGLTLAGAIGFFLLPVAPVPQIDYPVISLSASIPGASPETMASSVATPLERRLGQIAGVTEMTSSSYLGATRINLQFDLDRNIEGAQRDIQAAIAAARADVPVALRNNPTYRTSNPAEVPVAIVALKSDQLSAGQLFEIATNVLQQKFAQIEGVGQVTVGGSSLPAVRVEINPNALARDGVTLEDVRAALAATNYNSPKGSVTERDARFEIYANDQIRRASEYRDLVVAYRKGAAVRLRDIAEVADSVEDTRNFGLVNGVTGVQLQIFRQPGANFIELMDRVKALLPPLRAALPADVAMQLVQDRTLTIRSSLREIETTLLISISLVILVVYLFLKSGRATLIPAIIVPVSLCGSFGAIYLLGYSLNNLSLMALTIATGFIVDDVIVVVENVLRHREAGRPALASVVDGTREVAPTVIAMSLSLIAVFLPVLFMGGIVGRMMREFAMTLSVAIAISLLLSLTATPMLCARLLAATPSHGGEDSGMLRRLGRRVMRGYETSLTFALRHRRLTLALLLVTIGVNVQLYGAIPKGFFPLQDSGRMRGAIVADQSVSFPVMRQKLEAVSEILRADPAVEAVTGAIGGSFGPGGSVNVADLLVTLKPLGERKISADQMMARLRPKFGRIAGISVFLQSSQDIRIGGRSSNAMFQYTLQADDLDELRQWAPRIAEALRRSPILMDVNSDQQDRGLRADVHVDRETAARLGLTASVIDNTLYDAFGQRQVSTIFEPLNQYHVVMEIAPEFRDKAQALGDIFVGARQARAAGAGAQIYSARTNAPAGSAISASPQAMTPFSSFSRLSSGATALQVNHQGHYAAVTISFNLAEGKSLSEAEAAIKETMAQIGAPTTIQGAFAGTAAGFKDALASQPFLIATAIAVVYIVLGIFYESFLHPLTILSTLPSAGVGALVALFATGTELSVIAIIGILLLIGIVKKNAIILIDFALLRERLHGATPEAAIREACVLRFRPILMTTIVAMLGALPLAIGGGEGSELRQPLGVTVIGGLLFSQFLTLYTTPVVYVYVARLRALMSKGARAERTDAIAPGGVAW